MAGRPFLRCLGQPGLYSSAGEPVRFRTKKHLALLVYLAVEPARPHRRDRLAELLWPAAPTAEARHSLATGLSVIRPRLGSHVLQTTREHVLLPKGCVALDIDRLEAGDIVGSETREPLEVAGFLDGFDIPDAPEFALWKDRKSATLLPPIKAALVQLIDQCRRTADVRQIERLADVMLAFDDLSEEAVRAKMEARAFAGDRLTALRVFEDWRVKLKETVGAQPSILVEGMAVRLRRRGWERTDTSDIPVVPTDQWRGRLFVGRFEEYRLLYEAWEQTVRGRPRHVLVLGDSGVGKTTIVNRLVTAAGLEGAAVSRAQCYDLEMEIPYATLNNLMLGLLDLPGVSASPPESLAELARYFKCVGRRFPNVPQVQESQGETARLRLTEAFHQILETIAEDHPVILVVDDLHMCDEASLSVLHLLIHRVSAQPIMLVLVARAEELARSPIALRLRSNVQSLGIQEIVINPLSELESEEVLSSLLGSGRVGVDVSLRRAMVRVAGGFPMVLELLVQDWEAHGSHSLALALDSMTTDFASASQASDLYRRVLDRMAIALDPNTRNVLNVAAVLGHRLNDLSLYEIADLGPGQVMTAVADLVRRRILRDSGRGLEFVNEFVRTAAYLEVPSPVRLLLHSSIASRLIAEDARGVQFLGLEIAWHATRARQASDAVAYLMKGAHQAIAQGALDTAARALSTSLPRLASKERGEAGLLLAEVLQEQGRWAESAVVLADECSSDTSGLGAILTIMAGQRTAQISAPQLASDIRLLHSLVESKRPLRIRLLAINALSQLMGDLRDKATARCLCRSANELAACTELTEDERTQLRLCQAQLLYYSGQQESAAASLTDLVAFFHAKNIVNSRLARVYSGLGAVRCYQGRYAEAKAAYDLGCSVAFAIGNEAQHQRLVANRALCALRLGEYRMEIERLEHFSLSDSGLFYQRAQYTYIRAFALAMTGNSAAALQVLDSNQPWLSTSTPAWLLQAWKLYRADVLCVCGHYTAALAEGAEAVGCPFPSLHTTSCAGAFARWLALVSVEGRMCEDAGRILKELSASMNELDTLDRVELLCARLIVGDPEALKLELALRELLAVLPAAVVLQLSRLKALST